jgi:hypothetical protein
MPMPWNYLGQFLGREIDIDKVLIGPTSFAVELTCSILTPLFRDDSTAFLAMGRWMTYLAADRGQDLR